MLLMNDRLISCVYCFHNSSMVIITEPKIRFTKWWILFLTASILDQNGCFLVWNSEYWVVILAFYLKSAHMVFRVCSHCLILKMKLKISPKLVMISLLKMQFTGNYGRQRMENTLHTLSCLISGSLVFFRNKNDIFPLILSVRSLALLDLIAYSIQLVTKLLDILIAELSNSIVAMEMSYMKKSPCQQSINFLIPISVRLIDQIMRQWSVISERLRGVCQMRMLHFFYNRGCWCWWDGETSDWEGSLMWDQSLKNQRQDCCWKKYRAFWQSFYIIYESMRQNLSPKVSTTEYPVVLIVVTFFQRFSSSTIIDYTCADDSTPRVTGYQLYYIISLQVEDANVVSVSMNIPLVSGNISQGLSLWCYSMCLNGLRCVVAMRWLMLICFLYLRGCVLLMNIDDNEDDDDGGYENFFC